MTTTNSYIHNFNILTGLPFSRSNRRYGVAACLARVTEKKYAESDKAAHLSHYVPELWMHDYSLDCSRKLIPDLAAYTVVRDTHIFVFPISPFTAFTLTSLVISEKFQINPFLKYSYIYIWSSKSKTNVMGGGQDQMSYWTCCAMSWTKINWFKFKFQNSKTPKKTKPSFWFWSIKRVKYGLDRASIVKDTARIRLCPQTGRQTDGQGGTNITPPPSHRPHDTYKFRTHDVVIRQSIFKSI